MKTLKNKYILILTFLTIVSAFIVKYIAENYLERMNYPYFMVIPIFFFVVELLTIFFIFKVKLKKEPKSVNYYMAARVAKITLSLFFFVIMWLLDKENIRSFALLFIIFYVVFLLFETYFLYDHEKKIKLQIHNENKS